MKLFYRLSYVLLFSLFIYGCSQEKDSVELIGEVQFDLQSIAESSNGRISEASLSDADAILLTIENGDGSSTDYSLKELDLYEIDGIFISQKIALPIGDYSITEFLIIDSDDNIIHITPLEGSSQAQNVLEPLPIGFAITTDAITAIQIEVISVESLSLEDFGLVGFDLSQVNLFNFMINVSERGDLESLLSAELTITSDSYTFSKELLAVANNAVFIKDGFSSYDLSISKEGYQVFTTTISRDSLFQHGVAPLSIELVTSDTEGNVQERLDGGEHPISIYNSGIPLEDLDGATYEGGLIFYLNTSDGWGLVSSSEDQSAGIRWYNGTNVLTAASGYEIGTGSANTDLIISVQGSDENSYAAGVARAYGGGGYDDWVLPSEYAFQEMWQNLHKRGVGDFNIAQYWTSTEILVSSAVGFTVHGNGSSSRGGTSKSSSYNVRAIRSFE